MPDPRPGEWWVVRLAPSPLRRLVEVVEVGPMVALRTSCDRRGKSTRLRPSDIEWLELYVWPSERHRKAGA